MLQLSANYARLKDSDDLAKQLLFWEVDMPSAACLKQKLVHWKLFWNEGRREDKPEDLMDALPYADEDIFPNIRNWMYNTDWNLSGRKVFFSSTMTEERLTGLTMMSIHHAECLSF